MYSRPLGDYRFGYWLLGDEAMGNKVMGKEITQNIRNICVFAKNILSLQRY
jgi:hypothetical protein